LTRYTNLHFTYLVTYFLHQHSFAASLCKHKVHEAASNVMDKMLAFESRDHEFDSQSSCYQAVITSLWVDS